MTSDSDTIREHVTEFHWSAYDNAQFRPNLSWDDDLPVIRPGETIPGTRWKVVKLLGQGGVGEVFEVVHELLGRKAAFKVLHAHNVLRRGLAERTLQEGRLLGSLHHPNIVEALDMGVLADGRPYVVLELLDGRDFRAEVKRLGVLSVPAALALVSQVLNGLSALHEVNIVHRDIKLENLFLCADGHVEILDLGAAMRMGDDAGERAPSLGTPRTMAPEQYEGKPVDARADLYAVGIVLYELLTGRGPFDDVSGVEALRFAHCERTPAAPSRMAQQTIPPEIDALVLRALAKAPRDRFISARAMAAEVEALRVEQRPLVETRALSASILNVTSRWFAQSSEWISGSPIRRVFFSRMGVACIALLALLVAALALGIVAAERLEHTNVVVRHAW
ncbi:MAG TPA: serine/threonine-protein kinase [Polyangium sp.]|nr:serine/threonine-protein kinase [Polyangium sp.]